MITTPIPSTLADRYKGSGVALGAIDDTGELVALIYAKDIIPDFEGLSQAKDLFLDPRAKEIARGLEQEFGTVVIGMVSSWEFTIL